MRKFGHILALTALLGTTPLQAAHDTGLVLHDTGIGQRATGDGATAGVRIKLGSDRDVKDSERVRLGISAGPVFALPQINAPNGVRRGNAAFVGFEVKPGYSASFNLAGKPVLVDYTTLGAAEKDKEDDDKQSTGDKVAWVAAVAGGVMVLLVGGAAIYLANCNDCSE